MDKMIQSRTRATYGTQRVQKLTPEISADPICFGLPVLAQKEDKKTFSNYPFKAKEIKT